MYLSPDDQWPTHSRPLAQAALVQARRAGWWFEPTGGGGGHVFGRLRCVHPERDLGREGCVAGVWSTAGPPDGSETARLIHAALRKCPHGVPPSVRRPDPDGAAALARGELSKVEGLLDAAAGLYAEAAAIADADELLGRALEVIDQDGAAAEALERRALEQEQAARFSAARGLAGVARAGISGGWPPEQGLRELLGAARVGLAAVSDALREVNSQVRDSVATSARRLEERLRQLEQLARGD